MRIIIVSPHPDDETLGAGGSILKLKDKGNELYWLNVTDIKEEFGWGKEIVNKRKRQLIKIEEYYKLNGFINLHFPSTGLTSVTQRDLIESIGRIFDEVRPDCIVLPDYSDAHSDHRYVFDAAYACSKIFRRNYIKRILTMEVASETNFGMPWDVFHPSLYIDITEYIEQKLEVLSIYDTELGKTSFPRSLEFVRAQALMRGTEAGVMYAEAFRVIKMIE